MSNFDPNSNNAMFGKIIERFEQHEIQQKLFREELRASFYDLRLENSKTRHRVDALERDRWFQRGVVAAIAVIVTQAWNLFKK